MKRRQMSFPTLRFAAAAFVAASTTVRAGTAAAEVGGLEANGTKTGATNSSTAKEAAPLSSLTPNNISFPVHGPSSFGPPVDQGSRPHDDHHPEVGQGATAADVEPEGDEEPEEDELWENESGIVYGGFGWQHDKRGGEGGGGGGVGGVGGKVFPIAVTPAFLGGGHYPNHHSSAASRPRPFGFLRG